ncbi:putative porin [Janthinobacterium sp. RB2P8]|uniref:putative porin n=1 Tax=Janthinobacterium sp. RB2P8 TaxID=3424191 RepID=UPI003F288F61
MPATIPPSTSHLGGAYAREKNTCLNGRWTSSREVFASAPSFDALQIELNAGF